MGTGMTDDIVTRLQKYAMDIADTEALHDDLWETIYQIEQLRRWKELAYDMRSSAWWALRRKYLVAFRELHNADWENTHHE